ncbi:hypothetical protein [uncultured Enterobacter sp.]|uniref:hypothetical protein n=1 Tax=uncultured Enterobacter sp. TaxID=238202 RepID=UPI002594FEE1|nr:hypothetical protein [uncultured Enterobacter sp.]
MKKVFILGLGLLSFYVSASEFSEQDLIELGKKEIRTEISLPTSFSQEKFIPDTRDNPSSRSGNVCLKVSGRKNDGTAMDLAVYGVHIATKGEQATFGEIFKFIGESEMQTSEARESCKF